MIFTPFFAFCETDQKERDPQGDLLEETKGKLEVLPKMPLAPIRYYPIHVQKKVIKELKEGKRKEKTNAESL